MRSPVVSIVIPAFNAQKFIGACLNSVINQDFEAWEVIIIDDGSTDNTPETAELFHFKDCRIKYIRQSNRGVSAARNVGIEVARGQYIMFVDSDDILPAGSLTIFHEVIRRYPRVDIIRGEYEAIDEDGKILFTSNRKVFNKYHYRYENNVNEFYRNFLIPDCFLWLMWIRTDCIKDTRFVEGHIYMEDAEFIFSLMCNLYSCVYVPKIVYHYRKYASAASSKLNERKLRDIVALSSHLIEISRNPNVNLDAHTLSTVVNHCWNIIFNYLSEQVLSERISICDKFNLKHNASRCIDSIEFPSDNIRDFVTNPVSFYSIFLKRRKIERILTIPARIVSFFKSLF